MFLIGSEKQNRRWRRNQQVFHRPWHRKLGSHHCDGAKVKAPKISLSQSLLWCINISSDSFLLFFTTFSCGYFKKNESTRLFRKIIFFLSLVTLLVIALDLNFKIQIYDKKSFIQIVPPGAFEFELEISTKTVKNFIWVFMIVHKIHATRSVHALSATQPWISLHFIH